MSGRSGSTFASRPSTPLRRLRAAPSRSRASRPSSSSAWTMPTPGTAALRPACSISKSQPDCISVPVFPNRKFRLSYIYVRSAAGIELPRDLHGKRVGIRVWANTAGVWARGALQHHYGVDLGAHPVGCARQDESRIPAGALDIAYLNPTTKVRASEAIAKLDALLLDGAVDAVIHARRDSRRSRARTRASAACFATTRPRRRTTSRPPASFRSAT